MSAATTVSSRSLGSGMGPIPRKCSTRGASGRNLRSCQRCREKRVRCRSLPDEDACEACKLAGRPCVGRRELIFKMSEYVDDRLHPQYPAEARVSADNNEYTFHEVTIGPESQSTGNLRRGTRDGLSDAGRSDMVTKFTTERNPLPLTDAVENPAAWLASTPIGTSGESPSLVLTEPETNQNIVLPETGLMDDISLPQTGPDLRSETPAVFMPSLGDHILGSATATAFSEESVAEENGRGWSLTKSEAELLNYFIVNLAPWFDYCDKMKHFESQVVGLASEDRTLLYALLAVSAKHKSRQIGYDDGLGDQYQRCCLDILIPTLDPDSVSLSNNLLATALVLRFFEEMTEPIEDVLTSSHTLSVQLLSRMKRGEVGKSTLSDAAFIVMLRQEIFIANLLQRPFQSFTAHCNIDMSLAPANNSTWTFRIIAHTAEITNFAYQSGQRSRALWEAHARYLADWKRLKPPSFQPIMEQEHGPHNFPTYIFIGDLQLAAFQYQKLCELLLVVLDSSVPMFGMDCTSRRDCKVKAAVRDICGAAISDYCWVPAGLTAGLAIAMCGDLFHDADEQARLIDILEKAERHIGWPSLKSVAKLKDVWATR